MKNIQRLIWWSISLLLLAGCNRLDSIPYSPNQTPESWLTIQPFIHVSFGTINFTLVQPSSTIFVYALGLTAIGAGLYFLRIRQSQSSRVWWGVALLLWGAGALCAGTSYQAFSYEIKCAGRELCSWTSGWEICYLLLSAASVDAMMVAEAYACSLGKWRKVLITYALVNIALYTFMVILGTFALIEFLISFEMLILVAAPSILVFLILNGRRYFKFKERKDLALLGTWVGLAVTLGVYFLYLALGISQALWKQGAWFSENDILHIGLILWITYNALSMSRHLTDAVKPGSPESE